MRTFSRNLSFNTFAGGVGGLAYAFVQWLLGAMKATSFFGVHIGPEWAFNYVALRAFFGSIWGLLFFIPLKKMGAVPHGLILSLGPIAYMYFFYYPYVAGKGMLGLSLGAMTPVFEAVLCVVWGIAAAMTVHYLRKQNAAD